MTKEYAKTYCHSMGKSLDDKLFFLKEIAAKFQHNLRQPTYK